MSNTCSAFHLPLWRHLIDSLHASLVTHTTSVFGFSFPWVTANVIRLQDTWKQRKLPLGKPCYSLTISFEFCLFLDLNFILDFSVCLLVSKSRFNFLLCIIAYFVTNMPTHTCNPTTHETKAGGPGVPAQNRVHSTIIHRSMSIIKIKCCKWFIPGCMFPGELIFIHRSKWARSILVEGLLCYNLSDFGLIKFCFPSSLTLWILD